MIEHDGRVGCKHEGKQSYDEPCVHCVGNCIDKYQRKNNADRIRSMSDEELAEFINIPIDCFDLCDDMHNGCALNCKKHNGLDVILEWLQSESEEQLWRD